MLQTLDPVSPKTSEAKYLFEVGISNKRPQVITANSQDEALEYAIELDGAVKLRQINTKTHERVLVATKDRDGDWLSKDRRILRGADHSPSIDAPEL